MKNYPKCLLKDKHPAYILWHKYLAKEITAKELQETTANGQLYLFNKGLEVGKNDKEELY